MLIIASPAWPATYSIIPGGGGDYTTIDDCVDGVAAGGSDICEMQNVTYQEQFDEDTKQTRKIILERKDERRQPCGRAFWG